MIRKAGTALSTVAIMLSICSCSWLATSEQGMDPLERVVAGNERFIHGNSIHPRANLNRIRELGETQNPFVTVVSCSDSRVPPEIILDQGLGDVFTIRTAGNVIGDFELGSIEYAVRHLGCSLVVVLGHEHCGAIKAFLSKKTDIDRYDHIDEILRYISHEDEELVLPDSLRKDWSTAVIANIEHGVNKLSRTEPYLRRYVDEGKLRIIGGYYHIDEGRVEFFTKQGQTY